MGATESSSLSGGQMQRLAVYVFLILGLDAVMSLVY